MVFSSMRKWVVRGAVACIAGLCLGMLWWPTPHIDEGNPALVYALSSGVRADSQLDATGRERLHVAIDYAGRARIPLILDRIERRKDGREITSDVGQRMLLAPSGIEATVLPGVVRSTRTEVLAIRAAYPHVAHIAVVTSTPHTRRACAAFRAVGYRVTCIAAGWGPWYFAPYQLGYEMLAVMEYRWRRWM
jgi:DUF218 domain